VPARDLFASIPACELLYPGAARHGADCQAPRIECVLYPSPRVSAGMPQTPLLEPRISSL